jgi:uncharacterized protein YaaN involved in tellurite resistance
MTDTTTPAEQTVLAETEPAAVERKGAIAPLAQMAPEQREQVMELVGQIDIKSSNAIVTFGADAQQSATAVSESIIEQARNKDLGPVGGLLNDVVTEARGLDTSEVKDGKKPNWFQRNVLKHVEPVTKFIQQYESAASQIQTLTDKLEDHRLQMLKDIAHLDRLYQGTVQDFERLELYIAAGNERLRMMREEEIPAAAQKAEGNDAMAVEELNQLRAIETELERRVHDLQLTREVVMQALPQLRNHQNLDKSLAAKIKSVIVNTVPVWKQKMAQALLIDHTRQAAAGVQTATDFTNDLLKQNADDMRAANKEVRGAVERGIFDIEAVEYANQQLIGMVSDTLQITDEAKKQREEDAKRLAEQERKRKEALKAAAAGELPNQASQRELPAGA